MFNKNDIKTLTDQIYRDLKSIIHENISDFIGTDIHESHQNIIDFSEGYACGAILDYYEKVKEFGESDITLEEIDANMSIEPIYEFALIKESLKNSNGYITLSKYIEENNV